MKTTFLFGHLEAGDALILNGLIRTLAPKYEKLVWFTHRKYLELGRELMGDLPNVQVWSANNYEEVKKFWALRCRPAVRLGYFSERGFDERIWDSEMYRQAGVKFDARWSACRIPEKRLDTPVSPMYAAVLAHEDASRGFVIGRALTPAGTAFIVPRASILDWVPDMLAATELHLIDSAFLNLAESLYALGHLRTTRLVFHRYAKRYRGPAKWPQLRAPWEVLR